MEDETDLLYGDLNEEALKAPVVYAVDEETAGIEEEGSQDFSSTQLKNNVNNSTHSTHSTNIVPIAMPFLHLYPIDNFTFGSKDALLEIETSYHHRMAQLAESFKVEGMRRTVEAVLLTYQNNHPHVLLLQLGETNIFKL